MRIRDVIKLVVGSCAVYFVMAACSAYSAEEAKREANPDGVDASDAPSPISPVPNALAFGHKSGSRLKLRFWEGSDGSREFIDFFDSELQTTCRVGTARVVAGKDHCLPAVQGYLVFSDALCTARLGYVVSKVVSPQPRIGGSGAFKGGSSNTEYFQLGALANPPPSVFVGGSEGGAGNDGCSASTVSPDNNYYPVGAPLPSTAFVEMTIKNE